MRTEFLHYKVVLYDIDFNFIFWEGVNDDVVDVNCLVFMSERPYMLELFQILKMESSMHCLCVGFNSCLNSIISLDYKEPDPLWPVQHISIFIQAIVVIVIFPFRMIMCSYQSLIAFALVPLLNIHSFTNALNPDVMMKFLIAVCYTTPLL